MSAIAMDLKNEFQQILGTNGVFLYPTFPTTAHRHFEIYHKLVDTSYMMVFNTLGMPVTNCMVRLDKESLPIGIQVRTCENYEFIYAFSYTIGRVYRVNRCFFTQIITNPGQDHLLLAVAREIEATFGGWVKPS